VTVVLTIVAADGVVVAADTQVTDRDRGMSYTAQKLHPLGEWGAWGGSGARSVLTDLERCFEDDADAILASTDVGRALQERVVPVMRHHYEHFIAEVPNESSTAGPAAYVLAAGWQDGSPWVVEIDPHGMASRYEDIGFHAIGSGAAMAQQAGALLSHFRMGERPTRYGEVVAVRVIDALRETAPSVGGEIDLCSITDEGAHHLDEDEVQVARERAQRWSEHEQKALDELFD
jgi:proteasome beta subunit